LGFGLLVLVVLAGTAFWYWREGRQVTRERVEMLLAQAGRFAEQAELGQGSEQALAAWREAGAALDQARAALEGGLAGAELHQEVARRRLHVSLEEARLTRDREFLDRLAETRLHKDDDYEPVDTDGRYLAAFRSYGLDVEGAHNAELAGRVRSRPARVVEAIVAALDDWCGERRRQRQPEARWRPLVRLASALDDSPWRNDLRARLLEPLAGRPRADLLAADLVAQLAGRGGLAVQLLAGGVKTARRRAGLRGLAARADSGLPAASVQLLASLLRQEGDNALAVRLLRKAQRRHPGDVWLNHDLAQALHQQPHPDLDGAIRFYTAARAIRPGLGHALGHALEQRGRPDEAVGLFRELTRLRPDNARHRSCLGVALARKGDLDGAARELRRACELDPPWAPARFHLGLLLARRGDLDRAEPLFREAIRLQPTHLLASSNLGFLLVQKGRLRDAADVLERALEGDPRGVPVLFQLADVRVRQGRKQEAMELYRRLLAVAPNHAEAHTNLAILLLEGNDPKGGRRHLELAVAARPDLEQARRALGLLLFNQGRVAESIPHLRAAAKLDPKNVVAPGQLAIALDQTGQWDEARRAYDEAMKRFPDNAMLRYNLANALADRGRVEESLEFYKKALVIDPNYAEAHCNLGHRLRDLGQFGEALASLRRGHELGLRRTDWHYPSDAWVRDCQQLAAVEPRLPEFLSGRARPGTPGEAVQAARACLLKGRTAGCVRLSREALERWPELADAPRVRDRAAAAAALAGTGQGKDLDELSAAGRLEMRRRALTWLAAGLRRHRQALRSGPPAAGPAREALRAWQADRRFAAVRDPAGLAALPAEERRAWEGLWRAVHELAPPKK
jgi:Flp pilus assembly protein TadD